MKIKGYEKIIYTSLLTLGVMASYFFVLNEIHLNKNQIVKIMTEIGNESGREGALRFAAKSLQDTEKERSTVESLFVPREEVVSLIELLERYGRKNNLSTKIDSIELEKLPVETHEGVLLRLSAKGSYASIRNYLDDLHNLSVASEWQRVMISKQEKEGDWSLSIDMRAFKIK